LNAFIFEQLTVQICNLQAFSQLATEQEVMPNKEIAHGPHVGFRLRFLFEAGSHKIVFILLSVRIKGCINSSIQVILSRHVVDISFVSFQPSFHGGVAGMRMGIKV
jgi:hypothetical protein